MTFEINMNNGVIHLGSDGVQKMHPMPFPTEQKSKNWVLRQDLSDEFEGSTLNADKWHKGPFFTDTSWGDNFWHSRSYCWSWLSDNAYLDGNGNLEIKTHYDPHYNIYSGILNPYYSGAILSKNPAQYGYFEAKIKGADKHRGVAPAFWAHTCGDDPQGRVHELDFVEAQQRTDIGIINQDAGIHSDVPDGIYSLVKPVVIDYDTGVDTRNAYHIYGCEWNDNEIRFYFDNICTVHGANLWGSAVIDSFQHIFVSMGTREPLWTTPTADGFPTYMWCDYVRIWQLGS